MSDETIELDTPWRRDPEELAARLTEWARVKIDPAVTVCNTSAPGNGMSSETVLFEVRNARGRRRRLRRSARAAARGLSGVPRVRPRTPAQVHGARARATPMCPRPRCRTPRHDPSWLRFAVHRDEARRRRSAPRRPAVRVRWLGDGRDARGARPHAAQRGAVFSPGCTRSRPQRTTSRSSCGPSTARARSTSNSVTSAGTTTGRAKE